MHLPREGPSVVRTLSSYQLIEDYLTDLLTGRDYYKPFTQPWAFGFYDLHEKMHWHPKEVSLDEDVNDWNLKLSEEEKNLLTQLFRFFTQADVDVASGYTQRFLPLFGKTPEVAMMMASFAAREAVHIHAYSLLLDTIGMEETEYQAFHEYKEMQEKHEYLDTVDLSTNEGIAKALAVYSGFTEGMQLFSSFIILMNFARFDKMKGMTQIVSWSIRDESVHVAGMSELFKNFVRETGIDKNKLEKEIHEIARQMVYLEDKFIDLAFEQSGIEGLESEDVKEYIRYIADVRLSQLGFETLYDIHVCPISWADEIINSTEYVNFFEQIATDYSKGNLTGEIEDWG